MWRSTARLFFIAALLLSFVMLVSITLAKWFFWTILLIFVLWIASLIRRARLESPGRKARIATILATKPTYVAYGSGTPRWLAIPVYAVFLGAGLTFLFWEALIHPGGLTGFSGFLTLLTMGCTLPFAMIGATGTFKALAWHLRSRFPDKVLVFANDKGIGTADGWVIPYARIQRIDPCSFRSRFGHDDWIEIADGLGTRRVPVNMSIDPPDEILKQLRNHAEAGGADLLPALPNGRPPSVGSQLGYRMGR